MTQTILEELLSKVDNEKSHEVFQAMKVICDRIKKEEEEKFKYIEYAPEGSNILLSLEVNGRNNKEIGFLSLERESAEVYIAVYSTIEKFRLGKPEETPAPRRRKVWVINEFKPMKILTQFASFYKFLRSE